MFVELVNVYFTLNSKIKTKDITVTTGTTQYDGYYYGAEAHAITGTIISAYVTGTGDNHAAFIGYVNNTAVRVNSPVANLDVAVRVTYMS